MEDTWSGKDDGVDGKLNALSAVSIIRVLLYEMEDKKDSCWSYHDLKFMAIHLMLHSSDPENKQAVVEEMLKSEKHEIIFEMANEFKDSDIMMREMFKYTIKNDQINYATLIALDH